jgi:hypothetical protein
VIKLGTRVKGTSLKDNKYLTVEGTLSHISTMAEAPDPPYIVDMDNGERWWCKDIKRVKPVEVTA